MVAVAVLGIVFLASFSAISYARLQAAKDRERGVVLDYVGHYLEMVKGMPFAEVSGGMAINALYDGTSGSPNVRIPTTSSWFSLADDDYESFHPELVWLAPRNPLMRVTLTTTKVDGVDHTKQITAEVKWGVPTQSVSMVLIRVKDM